MLRLLCLFIFIPLTSSGEFTRLFPLGLGLGHGDQLVQSLDLSIRYPFFHHYYEQVRLSSNGLILFRPTKSSWESLPIGWREICQQVKCSLVKCRWRVMFPFSIVWRCWFARLSRDFLVNECFEDWSSLRIKRRRRRAVRRKWISFKRFSREMDSIRSRCSFTSEWIFLLGLVSVSVSRVSSSLLRSSIRRRSRTSVNPVDLSFTPLRRSTVFNVTRPAPFRGSIYGGYEVRLSGHCFTGDHYRVSIDGHPMDECRVWNDLHLVCQMLMLMDSGKLRIDLFEGETSEEPIASTEFFAYSPENHGELIRKNYADLTEQIIWFFNSIRMRSLVSISFVWSSTITPLNSPRKIILSTIELDNVSISVWDIEISPLSRIWPFSTNRSSPCLTIPTIMSTPYRSPLRPLMNTKNQVGCDRLSFSGRRSSLLPLRCTSPIVPLGSSFNAIRRNISNRSRRVRVTCLPNRSWTNSEAFTSIKDAMDGNPGKKLVNIILTLEVVIERRLIVAGQELGVVTISMDDSSNRVMKGRGHWMSSLPIPPVG